MRLCNQLMSLGSRYLKDRRASVLPFVALTFPILIGMAGLGTDAGLWMAEKRDLQTAADSAVLAAGWEIAQDSPNYMDTAAYKEALNNGYDPDANGDLVLEIVSQDDDSTVISVELTQDAETFFSKIIFPDPIRVNAYAEAEIGGAGGDFCILTLDQVNANAFGVSGSVTLNAPTCGLAVNSIDPSAISLTGNVLVDFDNVRVSGDYEVRGSVDFLYNSLTTNAAQLEDPYADLEVPDYGGCDETDLQVNSSSTLSPGVYCGGIQITGNNDIEFEPGVYIIDGGDFDVSGNGSLLGEGVTFILTGEAGDYAGLDITGGREIVFSSPESGEEWSGITFFQDRDAPQDGSENKIVGTSDIVMNGTAYFPSQELWFGGDSGLLGGGLLGADAAVCTRLIAMTVTIMGNPNLGTVCDNYDVEDIGPRTVKLIR